MIIIRISGGIGNQLFQYVFGKYLSEKFNQKVEYDIESYKYIDKARDLELLLLDNSLSISHNNHELSKRKGLVRALYILTLKLKNKSHYIKDSNIYAYINDKNITFKQDSDYYFDGYWQVPSIAEHMDRYILSIKFPQESMPENILYYKNLITECKISTSIHIRRGDYFSPKLINKYGVCDVDYYTKALDIINTLAPNSTIFIFSDDLEWVRTNLSFHNKIIYVENYKINSYWYILIMSLCSHNIISNSSFSWWGAYLNENPNKKVIAPKQWVKTNTKTIALDNWIKI